MATARDPYNAESRSSLWGFGATAAVAGGVGFGLYRAHPAIRAALASNRRDIAAEVAQELRTLGRFNVAQANTSAFSGDIGENILRNLADSASALSPMSGHKQVRADIAHAAYEAMLAGGKATHNEAYGAFQQILNQTSVRDSYEEAKRMIASMRGDLSVLTTRMGDLGGGGFYTESRFHEMNRAAVSSGPFVGFSVARQPATLETLADGIKAQAEEIQTKLNTAARSSGGLIDWRGVYNIEDTIGGKRVVTPMLAGSVGGEAINIPLANNGVTYGGKNLTSAYTTRQAYGPTTPIRSYTEEYVAKLEAAMMAQKTTTDLKHAVIEANRQIIEAMHDRDSATRAMALWRLPEPMMPSGGLAKSRLNRMQAVLAEGTMNEGLRNTIIHESVTGGRQLWPFGSPDVVAKGTFMTTNIAEGLFGPMGRLMGVEQQPMQFIREGFGVTAGAKNAATGFRGSFGQFYNRLDRKIKGPLYSEALYGGGSAAAAEAYSAPQLVAFYAKPKEFEGALAGKMFKEEAVMSSSIAPMMEYERTVQKHITLAPGFRTHQSIAEGLQGKKIGELVGMQDVGRGGFYGVEVGTGKEVWGMGPGGAEGRLIGAQLVDENTANIFIRETHKPSSENYWKFFSEESKYMGRLSDEARMKELLGSVGMTNKVGAQHIEAMMSGKLVQKNRMALMTQQIEAMSIFAADKLDRNAMTHRRRQLAKQFLEDPENFLNIPGRLAADNLAEGELQIQKQMVALSKKFGFTDQERALTFGLMDRNRIKELVDSGDLTLREAAHIARSRGVVGVSKMRLGDFAFEGGAGGRASLEHTGMRMIAMKGDEGKRFAAELSTRIRGKGELLAADRMMASALNQQPLLEKAKDLLNADTLPSLGSISRESLIQDSGRYVGLGQPIAALGGSNKLYIPGLAEAETMMGHTVTDKGSRVASPVAASLEELRALMANSASREEIEASAARLRAKIVQHTEQQAATKGRIIGSRFLTGIEQSASETVTHNGAFRVSEKTASRMIDELIDRAKTEEQRNFLHEQKRKLLQDGEELVGGLWRHPTTGPESFQFVRYKVDKNLGDEMIAAPFQMGEMVLGGKRHKVDISPMVGLKGDFDRDMFALSAISDRDTATRLAGKMKNEVAEGYTGYLFNHYAMKDLIDGRKGNVDSLLKASYEEAVKQGATKLTTAKIATPQVNVALQKLKLGLQHTAPEKYRPMAELFWHLEEAAIGGKHGVQNSKLYQQIAHAVNQKDTASMESVIKQLMGDKDLTISGQITGPTGQLVPRTLKYSPKEWAEQAINAVKTVGPDVDMAYKSVRAMRNKFEGDIPDDINQLVAMYYKRRTGSLDVAQATMHAQAYGMAGFTENTNRVLRQATSRVSAITGALKKAKGPAVIGAAIAAGIMLSAPSISGAIHQPKEGPAGGRHLGPDDLGPPVGQSMMPPSPRIMQSPRVYDMSGIKMASRANIRMSMADADSSSRDFMRHASTLARGGNVRVRTVDDRNATSPQRLANKIHERL